MHMQFTKIAFPKINRCSGGEERSIESRILHVSLMEAKQHNKI